MSSSINKTEFDIPNSAIFFKSSHPKAPEPASNIFKFCILETTLSPKIEINSSYLELFLSLNFLYESGIKVEYSKKSKIANWFMGVNFPVVFIISWQTTPPINDVIQEISAVEVKHIFLIIFSSKMISSF